MHTLHFLIQEGKKKCQCESYELIMIYIFTVSNYPSKQTVIGWDSHELGNPVVRSLFGPAVGYS